MAVISIAKKHALSHKKAKNVADKIAKDLKKRFELDYAWDGNVLRFERTGIDGELHVTTREVRLEAKLGFLLAFLKPRIEAEVEAQLDKVLGVAAKATAPAKKKSAGR